MPGHFSMEWEDLLAWTIFIGALVGAGFALARSDTTIQINDDLKDDGPVPSDDVGLDAEFWDELR